ncbi:MAG: GPR endopeptidase [Clostridia bacterium]|nr:GPR endopeptidase [Clostridia bacterium]
MQNNKEIINNGKFKYTTDMADERVDEYKKTYNLSYIDGIKVESTSNKTHNITTVEVLDENGKKALGKDIGKYITLEVKNVLTLEDNEIEDITQTLSRALVGLIGNTVNKVMVVGLGNEMVTADSLGPKVIKNINVTRHVIKYMKELVEPGTREITALTPGVLGTTGIETEEIIEGVVEKIDPDLIIVIDSLASQSITRIGTTIQMGNTGITPGAGVGNRRKVLNESTLKVPVIAIGVPTVVNAEILLKEMLNKLNISSVRKSKKLCNNMVVTPKEIDSLITKMTRIISDSINAAI